MRTRSERVHDSAGSAGGAVEWGPGATRDQRLRPQNEPWAQLEDSARLGGDAVNLLLCGRAHLAMSAMAWTLETHGYQVTIASSSEEVVTWVDEDQPEICLVWDDLAGDEHLAAVLDALGARGVPVMMLTHGADGEQRKRPANACVLACIDEATSLQRLLAIISSRRNSSTPAPAQPVVRQDGRGRGGAAGSLTSRELEALGGLVHGASTSKIATQLGVRPTTARTHIQNVLMKLGVSSRIEAVAYAVRHEVVELSSP